MAPQFVILPVHIRKMVNLSDSCLTRLSGKFLRCQSDTGELVCRSLPRLLSLQAFVRP